MRLDPEDADSGAPKPPPNYFSRRVQYRLIVLVSMFMLVLVMMDRVRDPKMWQWMWAGERAADTSAGQGGGQGQPQDMGPVNTQLPPPMIETPGVPDSISTAPRPLGEIPAGGDPQQRARDDMWARLLQSLSRPDQTVLDRVLKRHRDQQPLDAALSEQWAAVLPQLQSRAGKYFQTARRATEHATLPEDQQQAWLNLVAAQQAQWEQQTIAALQSLERPPGERGDAAAAALEQVQQSLDRLAMANIKDNTVMRADEARAWFRMFERLQRAPAETLSAANSQRVGFLQLFRQADVFRGKLVTIHGNVELAYRLQAPDNAFDIDSYHILWIRPASGPDNPVVVYTLELPPGFPPVADRRQPGQEGGSTELSEEVDVTGYYFKNWAYRSREGINTAPLLLARVPSWVPPETAVEDQPPLTWRTALISISGAGLLAAVLALLAFRSSILPKRAESAEKVESIKTLKSMELSTPSDRLRELSRREREDVE